MLCPWWHSCGFRDDSQIQALARLVVDIQSQLIHIAEIFKLFSALQGSSEKENSAILQADRSPDSKLEAVFIIPFTPKPRFGVD